MNSAERDEILHSYCAGLMEILSGDLDKVILYGSSARNDNHIDSDIDVLCVMNAPFDYGELIERTSELTARLSLEHGVILSRAFVTRDEYDNRQLPFLMNVRREGIAI